MDDSVPSDTVRHLLSTACDDPRTSSSQASTASAELLELCIRHDDPKALLLALTTAVCEIADNIEEVAAQPVSELLFGLDALPVIFARLTLRRTALLSSTLDSFSTAFLNLKPTASSDAEDRLLRWRKAMLASLDCALADLHTRQSARLLVELHTQDLIAVCTSNSLPSAFASTSFAQAAYEELFPELQPPSARGLSRRISLGPLDGFDIEIVMAQLHKAGYATCYQQHPRAITRILGYVAAVCDQQPPSAGLQDAVIKLSMNIVRSGCDASELDPAIAILVRWVKGSVFAPENNNFELLLQILQAAAAQCQEIVLRNIAFRLLGFLINTVCQEREDRQMQCYVELLEHDAPIAFQANALQPFRELLNSCFQRSEASLFLTTAFATVFAPILCSLGDELLAMSDEQTAAELVPLVLDRAQFLYFLFSRDHDNQTGMRSSPAKEALERRFLVQARAVTDKLVKAGLQDMTLALAQDALARLTQVLASAGDVVSMVRIQIRNLSSMTIQDDLEELFGKFGPLDNIRMKQGFAFLELPTQESAEAAIAEVNSRSLLDEEEAVSLIVTLAKEAPEAVDEDFGTRAEYTRSSTGYRVEISGISSSITYEDLKRLGRRAGHPMRADFERKTGIGFIDFGEHEQAKRAVKMLNRNIVYGHMIRVYHEGLPYVGTQLDLRLRLGVQPSHYLHYPRDESKHKPKNPLVKQNDYRREPRGDYADDMARDLRGSCRDDDRRNSFGGDHRNRYIRDRLRSPDRPVSPRRSSSLADNHQRPSRSGVYRGESRRYLPTWGAERAHKGPMSSIKIASLYCGEKIATACARLKTTITPSIAAMRRQVEMPSADMTARRNVQMVIMRLVVTIAHRSHCV
ncbi:hypothetical protein E5Q_02591 [Mixia osmundae IAM 14324]|uniref:RRM domain-containing protein n=1 Tax=Mixia osmundae (strain CBS 9802 / IAM 14324 / JCM 22182 / KY 12970) TaxID=764103 RepID=G7DZC4_MIXOS|nr:hypothetical protein E5Q_02591 [Mixia osmundae IAM 14324]